MRISTRLSTGILVVIFMLYPLESLKAISSFHFSTMVNYELIDGYWPGWDLTLIYGNQYGLRYTNIQNVIYLESTDESNNSLDDIKLSGELQLPMVLKTMDYNSFSDSNKTVFDFITAYFAFGYNSYNIKETHKVYSAASGNLVKETIEDSISTEFMVTAMGIYAGESFLVIDSRILHYSGETKESDISGDKYKFSDWMLIFSVGVGF